VSVRESFSDLSNTILRGGVSVGESLEMVSRNMLSSSSNIQAELATVSERISGAGDELSSTIRRAGVGIGENLEVVSGSILSGAAKIQGELADVAKSLSGSGQPLASSFRTLSMELTNGTKSVASALSDASDGLSRAFEPVSRNADSLSRNLALLEEGLGQAAKQTDRFAKEFASTISLATASSRDLKGEVDGFAQKLREGSVLLQGLQDLIHSVNRFIKVEPSRTETAEGRPQ
jgi:ABC-type transporter Mla subunit MlaD